MPFCRHCGNLIEENQAFCDKCGNPQDSVRKVLSHSEKKLFPFRFVRRIPFALVFFAFFLPLFVVSCPETHTEIARYSTYETLDMAKSANNLLGYMEGLGQMADSEGVLNFEELTSVRSDLSRTSSLCVCLLMLSVAALGFSFFKKRIAACLGVLATGLFAGIEISLIVTSEASISVTPGSGFWVGLLLYLAGIVLNCLPDDS